MSAKKGFTLIELLVVLAIVAILSVVVILTLNPAELLRQARDSNRISDLNTMKSALSLYLADAPSPVLVEPTANGYGGNASYGNCFASQYPDPIDCKMISTGLALPGVWVSTSSRKNVDGTGWIPVKFTDISSGAPIGNLPEDPINDSAHYYEYAATNTAGGMFVLATYLESAKYASMMVTSTDSGAVTAYRTGTASGYHLISP